MTASGGQHGAGNGNGNAPTCVRKQMGGRAGGKRSSGVKVGRASSPPMGKVGCLCVLVSRDGDMIRDVDYDVAYKITLGRRKNARSLAK